MPELPGLVVSQSW